MASLSFTFILSSEKNDSCEQCYYTVQGGGGRAARSYINHAQQIKRDVSDDWIDQLKMSDGPLAEAKGATNCAFYQLHEVL